MWPKVAFGLGQIFSTTVIVVILGPPGVRVQTRGGRSPTFLQIWQPLSDTKCCNLVKVIDQQKAESSGEPNLYETLQNDGAAPLKPINSNDSKCITRLDFTWPEPVGLFKVPADLVVQEHSCGENSPAIVKLTSKKKNSDVKIGSFV